MDEKDDCYSQRHQWLPGQRRLPLIFVFLFRADCSCEGLRFPSWPFERRLPRAHLVFGLELHFVRGWKWFLFSPCTHFISDHRGEGRYCPANLPLAITSPPCFFKSSLVLALVSFCVVGNVIPECNVLWWPAAHPTRPLSPNATGAVWNQDLQTG